MQKVSNTRIWLSPPHMSGYEEDFVNDAFSSNFIAPNGANIEGFSSDIEKFLGNNSFVSVTNSGTSAIHLALVLLNIKEGDEVLCQTKTFVASVNPVSYLRAKPIFIDSERDTWNLCPELLEQAIKERHAQGKRPKAIIAVHLYGMPYKVNEIHAIANAYGIPVIEDSAEAFGSIYNKNKCGTFGDFAILSFNGNKIITTSTGGALVCRNKVDKAKANYLANQAKEEGYEYNHKELGYNYGMSNVLAGIGRGQMKVLENYVRLRRNNFNFYKETLSHITDIQFQEEPHNCKSNRWLSCILLDSQKTRDAIFNLLKVKNIESRPSWKPIHLQPLYKDSLSFLNGTSEEIYHKGLCLPSGSKLNKQDLIRITNIIKSYF